MMATSFIFIVFQDGLALVPDVVDGCEHDIVFDCLMSGAFVAVVLDTTSRKSLS